MKLTGSAKFWSIFLGILFAAFLGGILGNWVFIYLLDKYYGIAGGNYLSAPLSSPVVVRDAKKVIAEQDNRISQAVTSADRSSIKIFKKGPAVYEAANAVATAAIMTSDGWLVSSQTLVPDKATGLEIYEAVTPDRRRFAIEKIVTDSVTGLNFIHLVRAQNLTVNGFVGMSEMLPGQTLIGLGFDGAIEVGRLSRGINRVMPSEGRSVALPVSDISARGAYLFDAAGEMAGVSTGSNIIAMDSIEGALEKLLTEGKIVHARLGINYLDLSRAFGNPGQSGSLITALDSKTPAIIPGSPADKAGLKAGDIILSVDGTILNEFNSLISVLTEYSAGDTISLSVLRAKETMTLSVTLDGIPTK